MPRFRIRVATSADWRALAEMRYRFRTELGSPAEPKSRFVRRCTSWMKKRFRVGSSPWRCWVLDDGKQLLGHVCVQLFEKMPNPVKDRAGASCLRNELLCYPGNTKPGIWKKIAGQSAVMVSRSGNRRDYSLG